MVWEVNLPSFIFIIDTDKYAGNFEREMCAFVTGHIGDCGVGEEGQKLFFEQFEIDDEEQGPFFEKVISIPDEHGCCRPTSIWITKDSDRGAYNSVAIFFDEQPDKVLIEIMKERAEKYCKLGSLRFGTPQEIKIKGFRLIKMTLAMGELSV